MKKRLLILIFSLLFCLSSCKGKEEYTPPETSDTEEENPLNYAPDTVDNGGFTVNDTSLEALPLAEILRQMLDCIDYPFEDKFSSHRLTPEEISECERRSGVDLSSLSEVLYYGPYGNNGKFALFLARLTSFSDPEITVKRLEGEAVSFAKAHGTDIEAVGSHTGRVIFFVLAEKGVIGDEDMATLLGSFASVDAEKYRPESEINAESSS